MDKYDTHIHTKPFSTDSNLRVAEVLKRQEETGLGIVLTEHMDYDFPPPDIYAFEPEQYFEAYERYRTDAFLLGLEIGLQKSVVKKNENLVRTYPFDMVIASIHAVCGQDLYADTYFQMFSDKKSAYTAYLDAMYDNLQIFDDFDTLGHIDYVCRKAPYADPVLHYEEFREAVDKILLLLAGKKKSLEINTRLFGKKEAVFELKQICGRFAQLGGRTVTTGSDAHHAAGIGKDIKNACQLAAECGLTPVYYRRRQAHDLAL